MLDRQTAALLVFGVVIPLLWTACLLFPLWLKRHQRRELERKDRRRNHTAESSLHTRFKVGGKE